MRSKLYLSLTTTILLVGLLVSMPIKPVEAALGVSAEPGVISSVGGSTVLTLVIDPSVVSATIQGWTVLEPDGDACVATSLPPISPGGSASLAFPDDFAPDVGSIDCGTASVGSYLVLVDVNTDLGLFRDIGFFDVTFFVLPESPIGALAIIGSSLAAMAAFVGLRRYRTRI